MQDTNIPAKFSLVWAVNASASFIRTIPATTASPIAASLSLGFPPETATPVAGGGTPPDVRDVNGILNQVCGWLQWKQAGGPIFYDSAFAASIGGYPKSALLANTTTPGAYWVSTVDNNLSDPDTGGANWSGFNLNALGTAAYKAASSNSQPNVASVSGTIVAGHLAVFADTNGTIADGGPIGTLGSAASKAATNVSLAAVSSFSGASTIGHFPSFVDGAGSIQDSGLSSASFDAAGAAATAQSNAQTFATSSVATETARAQAAEALLAPKNSPALTGTPTAPTAAPGTNNTQLATTAFVTAAMPVTIRYARVAVTFSGQSFNIASFNWNAAFPTGCLAATATAETNDTFNPNGNGNNFVVIAYGHNGVTTGGTIRVDTEQGGLVSGTVFVNIIGVGT